MYIKPKDEFSKYAEKKSLKKQKEEFKKDFE